MKVIPARLILVPCIAAAGVRLKGPDADKIAEGLRRQEERMKPDFSFSRLLVDKAEKGEGFTR